MAPMDPASLALLNVKREADAPADDDGAKRIKMDGQKLESEQGGKNTDVDRQALALKLATAEANMANVMTEGKLTPAEEAQTEAV